MLADRIGLGADGKLLRVLILAVENQRYSEGYALSAPALFAAKVK
jgi:hypothetical protein